MKTLDKTLIAEITERLVQEFHPEEIWLFGSYAWGEPDEGSDVDLMVVVKESGDPPIRRAQKAHRCLQGVGIAKDIIVKTREEVDRFRGVRSSFVAMILNRGKKIHG